MSQPISGRSGDDYGEAFAGLLPVGAAWPRESDAAVIQLVFGLAQTWGGVEAKARTLADVETDPRRTVEMLPDWERALGLPDPLVRFKLVRSTEAFRFGVSAFGGARGRIQPPPERDFWRITGYGEQPFLTLEERHRVLLNKLTAEGGQSISFFQGIGQRLGYDLAIREYSPFQFGLSSFGGPRGKIYPPSARFIWTVAVFGVRQTRFQFGKSSFGMDSLLTFRRAEDLEGIIRRWKPAHTDVIFNYGDAQPVTAIRFRFGVSRFGNDPILRLAA